MLKYQIKVYLSHTEEAVIVCTENQYYYIVTYMLANKKKGTSMKHKKIIYVSIYFPSSIGLAQEKAIFSV